MNEEWEDTFHSPKDVVQNFFQICYELKEAIKNDIASPLHHLKNGAVENFCNSDSYISLSLDIANQEKHVTLRTPRSGKTIGTINTGIHIFSPDWKNGTRLTIEIDWVKEDCLVLSKHILDSWNAFKTGNGI